MLSLWYGHATSYLISLFEIFEIDYNREISDEAVHFVMKKMEEE